MENSMIERVARVFAATDPSVTWEHFVDDARKAIAAMREPTEAMVKATAPAFKEVSDMVLFCHARGSHRGGLSKDPVPDAWRAMIDAALQG